MLKVSEWPDPDPTIESPEPFQNKKSYPDRNPGFKTLPEKYGKYW